MDNSTSNYLPKTVPFRAPVIVQGGYLPPVLPGPGDKLTTEKLLTEIYGLRSECVRLNNEIKRWRSRAILAKEYYTQEDRDILSHWLMLPRTRPPPLKRAAPAPQKAAAHTMMGRAAGGEWPSVGSPVEAARPVEQELGAERERSLDETIEEQLGKERQIKKRGPNTAPRRAVPPMFQNQPFIPPNWPQRLEELAPLPIPLPKLPPLSDNRREAVFGTPPVWTTNENSAGQSTGVLETLPENEVQNTLSDMVDDALQESLGILSRDRRQVPPAVKRVAAAREVVPQCPEAPQGRNRRRGVENARGFQPENQFQPLRRVSILGLCTTAEVDNLSVNEQALLSVRLGNILLKKTTEGTMDHISDPKVKGVPPLQHLSERFECSTLDAFEYAGLDLSDRLRVSATMRSSLRESEMVIAGDKDVNALLWMKELLEDATLDEVSRREITLYRNNIRWRMVGLPLSPIWVRELIWRTLMATVLHIESSLVGRLGYRRVA